MKQDWTPKPLSVLASSGAGVPWLLEGYIARGSFTLFTGLWKAGKTTFLSYLLRSFGDGAPFANLGSSKCRVLVVTEEAESMWEHRRDELNLGDHVEIISRPFLGRPEMATWGTFAEYLAKVVKERDFALVVLDSLPNLSPVKDENDAAQTISALTHLYGVADTGAAVLLISHPKKGDAAEGQATRGTGATPAFVDIIVEMRRHDPERRDTRRVLTAYSRYDETPLELVLDYEPGNGYRALGTKAEATASERLATVRTVLPAELPGLTVEQILAAWPDDASRPGERTLKSDLADAKAIPGAGIVCSGQGVKGDPYRYHSGDTVSAAQDGQEIECPDLGSDSPTPPGPAALEEQQLDDRVSKLNRGPSVTRTESQSEATRPATRHHGAHQ